VNGTIALHYSLIYDAKYRQIYDAKSTATDPGFLARAEGQSPTFVTDVNQAYDFYGDTYDFYFNMFGRDSIDNKGLSLSATVQFCPSTYDCPFQNAYWDPDKLRMYFGSGWTAEEDIIAHELTHGVTQYESNLIYLNQSGAINESLSDVFGKCVALTYHDSGLPSNLRWRIGFDSPIGAFRSMSDPTIYSDPDRLHSPYYYTGQGDNGGVHINSGVSNKLCFLLTDGQFFNGVHVNPMGIPKVAQLYYEAQVHLLVPSSNYHDLYAALSQAAHNIGTTFAERQNIEAAMCAVEIAPNSVPLRHFRAQSQGASGNVTLTWENRSCGSDTLILIRKTGGFPTSQLDGTVVFAGNADSFVDPGLASGTEYFYALDAPTGDSHPFTSGALFARVVAGSPVPSSFTEQFDHGSVDLSFTQILFTPNYDIAAAAASGKPDSYVNYSDYSATVTKNISALPIPRTNAIRLFLMDDGHDWVNLSTPLPYFGGRYNRIYVQANGAVAFRVATAIYGNDSLAQPLPTNFEVPQVSFLFSELSPRSGGEAWFRFMDDRVVVTFDKIPEFGSTKTNTVQTELFYSGHIRISYMELNALNAICGLSDGRGVPPDPLTYVNNLVDLSEMGISTRFALDPIPVLSATAGDLVTFTATTTGGTPPSASVAYSAIGLPPGASINPSSGQFSWPTGLNQQGQYNPTIKAQKGADVVAQDVTIYVADANVLPVASNLTITPLKPAIGDILEGHYTYSHATGVPEGASVITWYRNGTVVPILAGQLVVPSAYLQGGDSWSFSVTPVSASGLQGAQVSSSVVVVRRLVEADVNGDGLVDAVDIQVVINAALGIDVSPYDADVNGDGHVDSIDVQLIVNSAVS
ncbi:MAG: M4 family metallopeptidase, partial [Candidatus Hydrogenedentes bacterium]|nr:M4 family metallopeptidase [Candidatus Hydrogenedentota bacterium]